MKLSTYVRGISIIFLLLILSFYAKTASAQVHCAQIQKVEYTAPTETDGQLSFSCKVTVAASFSGSPNIACGMRINGEFPENVCPSDSKFEGWHGNETDIGCRMSSSTSGTKELIGYDFQAGCGPDTGVKVAFNPQPAPTSPTSGSPEPTVPGSPPSSPAPTLDIQHSSNPDGAHQGVVPNEPNPNPTPTLVPNTSFTTIRQVFEAVGCKVGVPPRILERVALTEFAPVFNYSADTINAASQPGGKMPNCPNNACAAEGVMQMTTNRDKYGGSCNSCVNDPSKQCCYRDHTKTCANQWANYGNAVNTYESLSSYTPDPCNIRDNIYAAALKLKKDSGATGDVCGTGAVKWTHDQVNKAGRAYYGSCVTNEGLPYCDLMWQYYNE